MIFSNYFSFFLSQKIEPFASSCSAAIASLQESIRTLNNTGNLKTSEVRQNPCRPSDLLIYVSPLTHKSSMLTSFRLVNNWGVCFMANFHFLILFVLT